MDLRRQSDRQHVIVDQATTAYNVNPAHCAITQLSNGKIVFVYSSGSGYAFQCRDADMNVTTAEMPLPTTQTVNNNGQYYGCAIGALMTEAQDELPLMNANASLRRRQNKAIIYSLNTMRIMKFVRYK